MAEDRITIVSAEGDKVIVDVRLKEMSGLVNNILEDSGVHEEIPLEQVKKSVLDRILEFCEHHDYKPVTVPKPIPTPNLADFLDGWDTNFIT
jgi:S-phase kinase-associated protein 1